MTRFVRCLGLPNVPGSDQFSIEQLSALLAAPPTNPVRFVRVTGIVGQTGTQWRSIQQLVIDLAALTATYRVVLTDGLLSTVSGQKSLTLQELAALLVTPVAPVARYVSSSTGSDANAGTQAAPWATFANVGTLVVGSTLYLKRGDVFTAPLVLTTLGVVADAYGAGAPPILNGLVSIKGVSGDWTQVAVDGVTASGSSNIWRRTVANLGQHLLVTNGAARTTWDGRQDWTGFTSWKEDLNVPAPGTNLTAAGRWYLPAAGSNFILVYSTSNPATAFATLELTTDGIGLDVSATSGWTVKNITLRGWTNGVDYGGAIGASTDIRVVQCAGFGHRGTKAGAATVTRPTAYDCGGSAITDHEDYQSNGMVFAGAGGSNALFLFTVIDMELDNCRDDPFHIGGNDGGNSPDSLYTLNSSYPGGTRITRSNHGENLIDNNQFNAGKLYVNGAYIATNDNPDRVEVVPTSAVHNFGDGVFLRDCIVNARHTGTDAYAMYNRRGGRGIWAINSVFMSSNPTGATNFLDGGDNRLVGCVGYELVAARNFYRPTDGLFSLLQNTLVGTQGGLQTINFSRATVLAGTVFSRSASPDGDGNYEYTLTCTNSTASLSDLSRLSFAGATGTSAALNGTWIPYGFTRPSTSVSVVKFKVPSALSPPSVVDKTGMTMSSCPVIQKMAGNSFNGTGPVSTVFRSQSIIEVTAGDLNPNSHWDHAGSDQGFRLNFNLQAGTENIASVNYTFTQITSDVAAAGNLKFDTNGLLGGSSNSASDVDAADPLVYKAVTSITVVDGLATVVAPTHGLQAGWKIFLRGATPNNLNHGQFVHSVVNANTFTFRVERIVTNQVATGTISFTDFTPAVGSPALGPHPLPDVSFYTNVDIQGRPLPTVGNYGAMQ